MWRRADPVRRLAAACCGTLLLAGCASTRLSHEPLAAPAQQALLQGLAGFRLDGRAFVQAGEEGFNASLTWRQHDTESQVRLSGPLGAGSTKLVYSPDDLHVTTSRGEVLENGRAEQVLREQLGFVPPFASLRYWVLGLAAPGESTAEQSTDEAGRITAMTQQGWQIRYNKWTEIATRDGAIRMPRLLTATREDLKLRVVVDRWKLQPGN
jgi:outer membrane lipoprotein LolB